MIKGIKFASIPVSDQDRALAFYTEQLGFRIATDQPMGEGQRWIELAIPGADTRVVLFTPEEHRDRIGTMQHVTFWADDVRKTFEELSARGVEFATEPQSQEWGSYAVFRDPDGNTFVLGSK